LVSRLLKDLRWSVLPVPGRFLAIVFFIFLFILPLITHNMYALLLTTVAAILTIFAVSWDLLSGYTGQVNFGHALFFGSGAYGAALLYKGLGLPPWATIPLGALIATGIGVATCFPALRLRPPYLSMLTMAFPIIAERIVRSLPVNILGGEQGYHNLPYLASTPIGESLPIPSYYICLIVMTVSVLIMWKLTDAGSRYIRTGLIFHAIREDEIAARATGINTIRYKILAFAIAGFFAGLAGALYAHYYSFAVPSFFSTTQSFLAIIWVVFGGIVSIYGPVVGVYTLYVAVDYLRGTPIGAYQMLIMTVIIIVILLFMPEGVAVWIRDKIERECPRCKLTNVAWRRECRACGASLH
jgi:branched-chain amino acid transport system permease protein